MLRRKISEKLKSASQIIDLNRQGFADSDQGIHRNVHVSALNLAEIFGAESGLFGELLLGKRIPLAELANRFTQDPAMFWKTHDILAPKIAANQNPTYVRFYLTCFEEIATRNISSKEKP